MELLKDYELHDFSQYFLNYFNVNSPLLSDPIAFILWILSFSTNALNLLKVENTSYFSSKKYI